MACISIDNFACLKSLSQNKIEVNIGGNTRVNRRKERVLLHGGDQEIWHRTGGTYLMKIRGRELGLTW